MDEYSLLAAAIIRQALEDYKKAFFNIKEKYDVIKAEDTIAEVEHFLRSGWFQILANDLDGEILIAQIKRMVNRNDS